MAPDASRPGKRRLKIAVACATCRRRKVKCDGTRPGENSAIAPQGVGAGVILMQHHNSRQLADPVKIACTNCRVRRQLAESCSYNDPVLAAKGAGKPQAGGSAIRDSHVESNPSSERRPRLHPDGHQVLSPSASGPRTISSPWTVTSETFTAVGDINAAVTTRLGPPSAERPNLIAPTDVPFFGLGPRNPTTAAGRSTTQHIDHVLPPRKHADHLVDIYWRNIHPLEPLVDRKTFFRSYEGLFSGMLLDTDERVFMSTLNTIFALSTQLQESLEPELREETSRTYFQRAWGLLRPETIMWEPGSLDIVQCLLLISRYLQCTNNSHRTWMVVGTAVRIAQSLGLDAVGTNATRDMDENGALKQHVWWYCVFMDRLLSWVFGRVSTVSLALPPTFTPLGQNYNFGWSSCYLIKTLDLYEITNRFMLSQSPDSNAYGDRLGLPRSHQPNDEFSTVMQLERCFTKWQVDLPKELDVDTYHGDAERETSNAVYRQAVLLRLRLCHSRIVIFRLMLARYCSSTSHATAASNSEPLLKKNGLEDRLVRDCALLCVESAQQAVTLVQRDYVSGENFGIIAWWHRVMYLHLAGTVLIAAMLRSDLVNTSVMQSWDMAMLILRAHSHLSPSIQQCVTTFQTLSSKIAEAQSPIGREHAVHSESTGPQTTYFQDLLQDLGLDVDNSLFGMEDMTWLSHFER